MKKIYYAHCINLYGTPQEKRDIATLQSLGFEVVNPNSPECSEGYKRDGMDYFKRFAKECDAIAFRATTPWSRIPAGVATEILFFKQAGKPIIELPGGIPARTMSVDETRGYLEESGWR